MDMNKTFYLKKEDHKPKWHVIDAKNQVLGRLATQIADILRGKDKPTFARHTDLGDYVVVINADHVKLTGRKWTEKIYDRYTRWMGGYKTQTARELHKKHPDQIITLAVKRMLPSESALARQQIKKLKVYPGTEHPHKAQISK